jgi:hypothetical protein
MVSDRRGGEADDSFVVHARVVSGCDVMLQDTAGAECRPPLTRVAGTHGMHKR